MQIEKILVAVAGRGLCEEMLNMLMDIPAVQNAQVTALHVVTPDVKADAMSTKLEDGGKVLAEAVKSMKVDPTKIHPRLQQGDAKTIVCKVADEENSDLIIMGSRALGRIQSILQNSVSQYVFQLTSRPMLLVKDDIYVKKIRQVMVALDGSAEAKKCLELAISFTKDIKGSQLVLVNINKDLTGKSTEDVTATAEKNPVLGAAVAEAKKFGVNYRCVVGSGKPGPEICRLAEELNVDLLLLGSPDRRPSIAGNFIDLDRLLGTSLSDYVRVHVKCPVLLAR